MELLIRLTENQSVRPDKLIFRVIIITEIRAVAILLQPFYLGEIMFKEILKDGIGEKAEFAAYHPMVNLIFFIFAIGITMLSTHPYFLVSAFIISWVYSVVLKGKSALKFNVLISLPMFVIMALINTLFVHNGATVLFYLFGNRVTMEALLYGIASAFLLSAVIVWFSSFNMIMSSDKLLYIFGKAAPVLGLTLSMILRFIPLLKNRYNEITLGQKCMGRHKEKGFIPRVRQVIKEVSILISWSLEASIETADSMEARGYGLRGRTSFHLFKFTGKDWTMLAGILIFGGIAAAGVFLGKTSMYYYPKITLESPDLMTVISLAAFNILMILPMIIDIAGEMKWQKLNFEE